MNPRIKKQTQYVIDTEPERAFKTEEKAEAYIRAEVFDKWWVKVEPMKIRLEDKPILIPPSTMRAFLFDYLPAISYLLRLGATPGTHFITERDRFLRSVGLPEQTVTGKTED